MSSGIAWPPGKNRLMAGGRELVGGRRAREKALGVEEDHEPVADLGDRVDRVRAGGRDRLELVGARGQDLLDLVDHDADLAGARLDDHDLAGLRVAGSELEPCGQVEDRDDLAAQADDAADPRDLGGHGTRLGEADDLAHRRDGEGVLLRAEAEDDELL